MSIRDMFASKKYEKALEIFITQLSSYMDVIEKKSMSIAELKVENAKLQMEIESWKKYEKEGI